MSHRDAAEYNEASFTPDLAGVCDTLDDHVRELVAEHCNGRLAAPQLQAAVRLAIAVVRRLLDEGRLGPLVELRKLQGRELLACLIGEVIEAPDARLMARCIDFTFELGVQQGISQTIIGDLSNLGKATASRYCVQLKETYLEGRPAPGMKSAAAVENYKRLRTGRSSRPPRQEWTFAATFHAALAIPA